MDCRQHISRPIANSDLFIELL